MKKLGIITMVFALLFCSAFAGCSQKVDYPSAEAFESALNEGEEVVGKTVTFEVKEFVPDSAFGYNLQAGEHLNFCSPKNPNVKVGDKVTVEVTSVDSLLGSYIIYYKIK